MWETVDNGMIEQHLGGILDSFRQASKNQALRQTAQKFPEEHLWHLCTKAFSISSPINVSRQIWQSFFGFAASLWRTISLIGSWTGMKVASCGGFLGLGR
jgi:hypothetical protein